MVENLFSKALEWFSVACHDNLIVTSKNVFELHRFFVFGSEAKAIL